MQVRVWSEFLNVSELAQPSVARLMAAFDCGVLLRTEQASIDGALAAALAACRDVGLPDVGLWLLLDPEDGYWPSERNTGLVRECVRRVIDLRMPVTWLAVDLEPPVWQARRLSHLKGTRRRIEEWRYTRENLDPRRFEAAWLAYGDTIEAAHRAGLRVLCAAHDYLAEDVWLCRPVLQDAHEAPVIGLPWDAISVMLYGSLYGVPERDARRLLYDTARRLRRQSIGASIGLTGPGVLGSEPHYQSPAQLGEDTAALKAAGVRDFAIYSLEGMLNRGRPEDWLRAVIDAEPLVPPSSRWASRERVRRRLRATLYASWRALATNRGRRQ